MSGKYTLFKTKAAARFSLKPATMNAKGFVEDDGAIFVEMADLLGEDGNGNRTYNWEQKILLALGMNDITILNTDPFAKLTHLKNEKDGSTITKTLQFSKLPPREGQEDKPANFMLNYNHLHSDGSTRKVGVMLTPGEFRVFMELLKYSVPRILGWDRVGNTN